MTRNQPACVENTEYLAYVRQSYISRLIENLPKTVLEKDAWLTPPPIMQEVGHAIFIPKAVCDVCVCVSILSNVPVKSFT